MYGWMAANQDFASEHITALQYVRRQ